MAITLAGLPTPASSFDRRPDRVPPILLNLFDDVSVLAVFERFEINATATTWVGHVEGVEGSTVTLVYGSGRMTGSVVMPDATYSIRPAPAATRAAPPAAAAGLHVVSEVDQTGFRPEAPAIEVALPVAVRAAADEPQDNGGNVIDVLVVYTPGAVNFAGDTAALLDLLALGVSETNSSYGYSGVTQRIQLAHAEEVPYVETESSNTALINLRNGTGAFAGVGALRDAHAADVVMLVQYSPTSSSCGIAYVMDQPDALFEGWAFSLVEADCISPNYTFAHELGHNMGLRHDWFVDSQTTPFTYAHGHVNPGMPGNRWRTIMSYNDLCDSFGFNCTRLLAWANPTQLYGGSPMGVTAGTDATCSTGSPTSNTCDADDRQVLNTTAVTVANFRQGSPAPFATTSPSNGEVVQPEAITLGWQASARATSYEYCYDTSDNNTCDAAWTSTGAALGVTLPGLAPGGTFHWLVRAVNSSGSTLANGGTWRQLRTGAAVGVDFATNGAFSSGTTGWRYYATPDISYLVSDVTEGRLEFYRVPPPVGTTNQAVVFQETGMPLVAYAPAQATFELGNSDAVRKRISVLFHDSDFSDLSVCTFWLPANAPLKTYGIRTHTTKPWANATIAFHAASTGSVGGAYLVDNVSIRYAPALPATRTDCLDPLAPKPGVGADSADMIRNGTFSSGAASWGLYGTITQQITNGVFEFLRPTTDAPGGVVLQNTGQAIPTGGLVTSTFELGNSSGVRKRVTVILHDGDFSDLSACTYWLEAGQPLSAYAMRSYATAPWVNATLSIYPATTGSDQWIRLDNVTLRQTPSADIAGTECVEPGGGAEADAPSTATPDNTARWSQLSSVEAVGSTAVSGTTGGNPGEGEIPPAATPSADGWIADGFVPLAEVMGSTGWIASGPSLTDRTLTRAAPLDLTRATDARLSFLSWVTGADSRAAVSVSLDGVTWETVFVVGPSDTWVPVEVDLTGRLGALPYVRLTFESAAPNSSSEAPDTWRIDDLRSSIESGA